MPLRQALSTGAVLVSLTCTTCTSSAEEAPTPSKSEQPTPSKTGQPAPVKNEPPAPKLPKPAPTAKSVNLAGEAMGTIVSVNIWTDDEEGARDAGDAVIEEFKRVDALMSSWLPDSAVARINNAAGTASVMVNEELFSLISTGLAASKASQGAFDITVGAFRGLWKFDQDIDGSIPKSRDVARRTKLVGYQNVRTNEKLRSIRLAREGMRITLGGIAKGHAVDRSVALLRERGFRNFIVQAGGDLFASGTKGHRKWRVGIRDPRGAREESFAVAEVEDRTFSTSGDYERFVVKDGVRYHHLLDPKTGRPATRSRSVTVLAPTALTADIWSTALFILGHEKGMKIVESREDLDAVFVDKDNHVHISSGLQGTLRMLKAPTEGI